MAVGIHPAFVEMAGVRARVAERFEAGALDGLAACRALSDAMDAAIVTVWRELGVSPKGVSLVVLGGYGRGLLSPQSDVDIMVLHDNLASAGPSAQPLFYALWDAGLKVGHAVRTPREALRLAKENLEAETSFLDLRLLAGDEHLFAAFERDARAKTKKRGDGFITDVREMMRLRHLAHGSATSQLEPNIKEGTGGLRDLHVLDWFEAVVGDLVTAGFLDAEGRAELDAAHELLLRARGHLHLATGHPNDTLSFQLQRPVATAMGYDDTGVIAEDAFMRDLFTATRAVELTVQSVAADLGGRGAKVRRDDRRRGPFVVSGGRVLLDGTLDLKQRPEDAIGLFGLGVVPGAAAMRAVRAGLRGLQRLPLTPAVRDAFIALLRGADGALLEMADHAGIFAALFPEWDAIRCQPQRNIYHRYTVDAHLFHAAEHAGGLRSGDDRIARGIIEGLSQGDRDLLQLAALFHDVGKGHTEDHSARGERLVRGIADRLGLAEDDRELLCWLVREHLLLVETATRRDLADEALIVEVATRIGDERRLALLHLLTVADGIGTGPAAWGPWKASLVHELAAKVRHVLERGELATADAARLARERRLATERLAGPNAERVARHLDLLGRAYLLAFDPPDLIRHAELAEALGESGAAATGMPADYAGIAELIVVARDRPGLFSKVSGVLALHGISIVAAQVFTRSDHLAIESFRCVGSLERELGHERWARVIADIDRALRGRLSIEARLAEKRAAYLPRENRGSGQGPRVVVDNGASDFMTVVEVHAPDRLGLLFEITAALAELSLDIQVAKIATYGDDIVDVFYVRDLVGQKIVDADHVAEIERALLHRLS